MEWPGVTLSKYPGIAVYVALTVGYGVGHFRFRGFSLGAVAGIVVGCLFEAPVSSTARSLLFLFGIGGAVGSQFFRTKRGQVLLVS